MFAKIPQRKYGIKVRQALREINIGIANSYGSNQTVRTTTKILKNPKKIKAQAKAQCRVNHFIFSRITEIVILVSGR